MTYKPDGTFNLEYRARRHVLLRFPGVLYARFRRHGWPTRARLGGMPLGPPTNVCKQLEVPLDLVSVGEAPSGTSSAIPTRRIRLAASASTTSPVRAASPATTSCSASTTIMHTLPTSTPDKALLQ